MAHAVKHKKIKVAIVHDFLTSMGGAERVTLELCNLYPDAPIYTLLYNPVVAPFFANKKIIVSKLQWWYKNFHIPVKFLFPWMPGAIELFDFSEYDLVISSCNSFAKGIILPSHVPQICYMHSPTRYLWDAYHTYIEEQRLPEFIKNWVKGLLHNLRMWDKLASERVTEYVANSRNVQQRITKYYRKDSTVVYPPVDTTKIKLHLKHTGYFLVVSRLSSYKKIDLAIRACNQLKLPLVIIGDGEQKGYLKKIAGPTIQILGWQDDKTKIEYLKNARALIFPGEEDFGIVPVEAMAAGKPVVAYNRGGVTESVVEGKTGIFFNEPTVNSLVIALRKFLAQESKFDARIIANHAQQFSIENFRQRIMLVINKVIKR